MFEAFKKFYHIFFFSNLTFLCLKSRLKNSNTESRLIATLSKDFLIDGRRSLIWEVRLGG